MIINKTSKIYPTEKCQQHKIVYYLQDGESYMVVIFKESLPGGIDPFSWFELKSLTLIKYKEKIKYQWSCTFIIGKPMLHHGEND